MQHGTVRAHGAYLERWLWGSRREGEHKELDTSVAEEAVATAFRNFLNNQYNPDSRLAVQNHWTRKLYPNLAYPNWTPSDIQAMASTHYPGAITVTQEMSDERERWLQEVKKMNPEWNLKNQDVYDILSDQTKAGLFRYLCVPNLDYGRGVTPRSGGTPA